LQVDYVSTIHEAPRKDVNSGRRKECQYSDWKLLSDEKNYQQTLDKIFGFILWGGEQT
jgi:hypothetical protein